MRSQQTIQTTTIGGVKVPIVQDYYSMPLEQSKPYIRSIANTDNGFTPDKINALRNFASKGDGGDHAKAALYAALGELVLATSLDNNPNKHNYSMESGIKALIDVLEFQPDPETKKMAIEMATKELLSYPFSVYRLALATEVLRHAKENNIAYANELEKRINAAKLDMAPERQERLNKLLYVNNDKAKPAIIVSRYENYSNEGDKNFPPESSQQRNAEIRTAPAILINNISYPALRNPFIMTGNEVREMTFIADYANYNRTERLSRLVQANQQKFIMNPGAAGRSDEYAKMALYVAQSFAISCVKGNSILGHSGEPKEIMQRFLRVTALNPDPQTKTTALEWAVSFARGHAAFLAPQEKGAKGLRAESFEMILKIAVLGLANNVAGSKELKRLLQEIINDMKPETKAEWKAKFQEALPKNEGWLVSAPHAVSGADQANKAAALSFFDQPHQSAQQPSTGQPAPVNRSTTPPRATPVTPSGRTTNTPEPAEAKETSASVREDLMNNRRRPK